MAAGARTEEESIPELGRALVDDVKRMVQLELQLAREQAASAAKGIAVDVGLFSVAGVLLLIAGVYVIGSGAEALGWLGHWWGWLATAGVLVVLAGLIAFVGYRRLRRTIARTKATFGDIKGDAEWLRQLPTRDSSSS
jgi:hypothetical protein